MIDDEQVSNLGPAVMEYSETHSTAQVEKTAHKEITLRGWETIALFETAVKNNSLKLPLLCLRCLSISIATACLHLSDSFLPSSSKKAKGEFSSKVYCLIRKMCLNQQVCSEVWLQGPVTWTLWCKAYEVCAIGRRRQIAARFRDLFLNVIQVYSAKSTVL